MNHTHDAVQVIRPKVLVANKLAELPAVGVCACGARHINGQWRK